MPDTSQKKLEETKINTKAIENMYESNKYVKTLEILNKNETIDQILIRPIAKLLVPEKRNQFRLNDDPDNKNWNEFLMKKEKKVRIYDDKLLFTDTAVIFTLKEDLITMITDYDFNKKDSPVAKKSY